MGLHERGYLAEAEGIYREILNAYPRHAQALLNLGMLLSGGGRHAEALEFYDRALNAKPDDPLLLFSRGNCLALLKRHAEALASYDQAVARNAGVAVLHFNRGVVLEELESPTAALASYDQALAIEPLHAGALSNRGNVLRELKRFDEALASYDQALAINSGLAAAWNTRGNALRELRRYDEALASYDRALAIDGEYPDAYYNLGVYYHELKHYEAAIASHGRALAIKPDYPEALHMRGVALQNLNRHRQAMSDFEQLLKLRCPDIKDTEGNLLHSKIQICDWRKYDAAVQRVCEQVRAGVPVIPPFAFVAVSDSPADQLLCARAWATDKIPAAPAPIWKGERYRHERIRIAYLSADLRDHPVAHLLAGMFEQHDRQHFDTVAISFGPAAPSAMRTRLESAFGRFIDVRDRSDLEIAQLLRELEIDIAVDLMGYTRESRTGIFALRAVPVQASYIGYLGTMGTEHMDYLIADGTIVPAEQRKYYSEKIVYLPSYQANDSKRVIAGKRYTRAELGLPQTGFVYCCFNNNFKITAATFDGWMRILQRVQGSVLFLYADNDAAADNLRKEAAARGVAAERLVFGKRLPLPEYLARYRTADLFLDTLPYNAGTTASDALWAGLPVVTRTGATFSSRVAASVLNAIELPELITETQEAYEALAVELAVNPLRLTEIKNKLELNRLTAPLFDTARFTKHIETAYREMHERAQAGLPPDHIVVLD